MKISQDFNPSEDTVKYTVEVTGRELRQLRHIPTGGVEFDPNGGVSFDLFEGGWLDAKSISPETVTFKLLQIAFLSAHEEVDETQEAR